MVKRKNRGDLRACAVAYDRAIHEGVGLGTLGAMRFEERGVHTPGGPRRVLVVSADTDTVFGADQLQELRSRPKVTLFGEIARRVEAGPIPDVVCLRGRGADGSGQFRMARSLEDEEVDELGYRLLRALMPPLRRITGAGVGLIAAVELRVREQAALRAGAARLLARLRPSEAGDGDGTSSDARTRHILQHQVLWSGVGLETALTDLIPARLGDASVARRVAADEAATDGVM